MFKELIKEISDDLKIDTKLLTATVKAESNGDPYAFRVEPSFYNTYLKKDKEKWANTYKKYYNVNSTSDEVLRHVFSSSYGLCQIMYSTALENGYDGIPERLFNPFINLYYAGKYLAFLYSRFGEIPNHIERMKFTIASYNAGRGSINAMLRLARSYYNVDINTPGEWQYWDISKEFLNKVTGQSSSITIRHIDRIKNILELEEK